MTLLEVSNLSRSFGGIRAVEGVSFDVNAGELVSLIGPNGAGKTTVFNLLTGIYPPSAGSIRFSGREIGGKKTNQILRAGIARTFQNIRLFATMTVLENVLVGMHKRMRAGLWASLLHPPSQRAEEARVREEAAAELARVGLDGKLDVLARNLSYGEQRRLEIARALASKPELLLLDEPAAGMNQSEARSLMQFVRGLTEGGQTVLFIEHNMRVVMGVSDRVVVLDHGVSIAQGTPAEVQADPQVITAYLGKRAGEKRHA